MNTRTRQFKIRQVDFERINQIRMYLVTLQGKVMTKMDVLSYLLDDYDRLKNKSTKSAKSETN